MVNRERQIVTAADLNWLRTHNVPFFSDGGGRNFTNSLEVAIDKDKGRFLEIFGRVISSGLTEDQSFCQRDLPAIEEIALQTELFRVLNSTDIVVSLAHRGTTPFEHIFNVIRKLNTEGLSPVERIIVRLAAYLHDIGKVAYVEVDAIGRVGQINDIKHSVVGAEMTRVMFKLLKLPPDLTESMQQKIIRLIFYHHSFKGVKQLEKDKRLKTLKERGVDLCELDLLKRLIVADMSSVPDYLSLVAGFIRICEDFYSFLIMNKVIVPNGQKT